MPAVSCLRHRADQGDEAVARKGLAHPADLILPPDEARELRPEVRPGARPRLGCLDLPAQHLKMDGLHFRARVDAQFVAEPGTQRLVRRDGVGLPPGRGQCPHQQGGYLLVQRVLGG